MRKPLKYIFILSFIFPNGVRAKGSKPPAGPQREQCSYVCKEIPLDNEIMSSFGSAHQTEFNNNLSILVWNVYKAREKTFYSDLKKISQGKDLILIQEMIEDQPTVNTFLNLGPYLYDHATSFFMKDEIRTGVMNGSLAQALSILPLQSKGREPFSKSPKMSLISEFKIKNSSETLLVANIHGVNFEGVDGLLEQVQQVAQHFVGHRGPILFAGDFNSKDQQRVDLISQELSGYGMTRVSLRGESDNTIQDQVFARGMSFSQAEFDLNVAGSDHPPIKLSVKLK